MTEGKQSDNTREKVSYILVAQDLDNTNAATFDTFYNAEDKNYKSLRGGGDSGSFKFLYTAMQIKRKQKKRLEKKRETISNKERKEKKRKEKEKKHKKIMKERMKNKKKAKQKEREELL